MHTFTWKNLASNVVFLSVAKELSIIISFKKIIFLEIWVREAHFLRIFLSLKTETFFRNVDNINKKQNCKYEPIIILRLAVINKSICIPKKNWQGRGLTLSLDWCQNWYMLAFWVPFNTPTTNENTSFGLQTSKI